MIPLELDQYRNDPVINQHIMQMIDTDILWYRETFRAILMELRKIRNGEMAMKTSGELNEKESYESAMMCWESLDDLEQASKKRKTHAQDEETNDKANEMDDKMHTKHTANTGIQLNIPVDDLKLGADDNASTLAIQETLAKNLVYITNIPEGKLDSMKSVQDSSKNPGEQDNKKCSPLEKSDQVTSNDNLTENLIEMTKWRRAKNVKRIPGKRGKLYIWNLNRMMMWQNNRRTLMSKDRRGSTSHQKDSSLL